MSEINEIEVPVWAKKGKMLVRRDALNGEDPDHPYNYIRATYGVDPETFGVRKPPPTPTQDRQF